MRKLTVEATPIGKPRQSQRDKWKQRPCVMAWRAYADRMRLEARRQDFGLPDAGAQFFFMLPMPKSWSAKKRKAMLLQPHQQKPDIDNLIKAVLDALCEDDCTVWQIGQATKVWGDIGKIIISEAA